ncbi:MAG: hypothetical protein HPPSJP_2660 [Candidatus Hepatoplasma scabrum]|nr:MAG: hypothetical protein HPPSJP_2660 [Candidatus Hepatoplasma sp.]
MNLNIAKLKNLMQSQVGADWNTLWENNMALIIALIILVATFLIFLILLFVIFYKNRKIRKKIIKNQDNPEFTGKNKKLSKKEKQKLERQKIEQQEAKEALLEDENTASDDQIVIKAKKMGIENPEQYSTARLEQLIMLREMKEESSEVKNETNQTADATNKEFLPVKKTYENDQNLSEIVKEEKIEKINNDESNLEKSEEIKEDSEQFKLEQAKLKIEQEKLDIEKKRLDFAKEQAEKQALAKFSEENKEPLLTKEVNIENLESRKEELEQLKKERELIFFLKNERESIKKELEQLKEEKDNVLKKGRRFYDDKLDEEENYLRYLKMMHEKDELERLKRENAELNRLRYQRENYREDYYPQNRNQREKYYGDDYYFKHSLDHEFENLKKLQEENLKLARQNSEQIARQQLEREIEEKYKEKYQIKENNLGSHEVKKNDRIENILLSVENEIEKLARKVSKIENGIKEESGYLKKENNNKRIIEKYNNSNYDEDEIIRTIQQELNEINDILNKKKK